MELECNSRATSAGNDINACIDSQIFAQDVTGNVTIDCQNSVDNTSNIYNGNCLNMNVTCGSGNCLIKCDDIGSDSCLGMIIDASLSSNYKCIGNACNGISFVVTATTITQSTTTNLPTTTNPTTDEPTVFPSNTPSNSPSNYPTATPITQIPSVQNLILTTMNVNPTESVSAAPSETATKLANKSATLQPVSDQLKAVTPTSASNNDLDGQVGDVTNSSNDDETENGSKQKANGFIHLVVIGLIGFVCIFVGIYLLKRKMKLKKQAMITNTMDGMLTTKNVLSSNKVMNSKDLNGNHGNTLRCKSPTDETNGEINVIFDDGEEENDVEDMFNAPTSQKTLTTQTPLATHGEITATPTPIDGDV